MMSKERSTDFKMEEEREFQLNFDDLENDGDLEMSGLLNLLSSSKPETVQSHDASIETKPKRKVKRKVYSEFVEAMEEDMGSEYREGQSGDDNSGDSDEPRSKRFKNAPLSVSAGALVSLGEMEDNNQGCLISKSTDGTNGTPKKRTEEEEANIEDILYNLKNKKVEDSPIQPEPKTQGKRGKKLPVEATKALREWLKANEENPHPSETEISKLAKSTGISSKQVRKRLF